MQFKSSQAAVQSSSPGGPPACHGHGGGRRQNTSPLCEAWRAANAFKVGRGEIDKWRAVKEEKRGDGESAPNGNISPKLSNTAHTEHPRRSQSEL